MNLLNNIQAYYYQKKTIALKILYMNIKYKSKLEKIDSKQKKV